MNTKELSAMLNGREYRDEVSDEIRAIAHQNGIVIVYGASDDLMEFDGAYRDELGAYDGTTAYMTPTGLLQNDCDNDGCPHFAKLKIKAVQIRALWNKEEPYSWTFSTVIPHETFEVFEDGEKYCRGIVFALADVAAPK